MRHFETELPEGYKPIGVVDAKDKKTILLMNLASIVLTAAPIALLFFLIRPFGAPMRNLLALDLALVVMMLAYIVLHELVHGAAYKLLTHRKLTFGISLTVAYCGVPDIFVYRRAAMIALLAPFTVFSVIFIAGLLIASDPWVKMLFAILFSLHFGGCVGDLYDTFLYLTRYRDPEILMQDTGPRQTFYGK